MANMKDYYDIYMSKLADLILLINPLEKFVEINDFRKELKLVTKDVEEKENGKSAVDYRPFIKRIDLLTKLFRKYYQPLLRLFSSIDAIDKRIDGMDENNRLEITKVNWELLNFLDKIKFPNEELKKISIEKTSEVLYKSIIHEAAFDKYTTFNHIMGFKTPTYQYIKEYIFKDAKNIPYGEHDLNTLKEMGGALDNTITPHLIKGIALKTLKAESDAFIDRKRTVAMDLLNEHDNLIKEKKELDEEKNERRTKIRNLRIRLAGVRLLLLSYVIVPVIAFTGLSFLGGNVLRNYKTTKRVYNGITNENIENEEVTYTRTDLYRINIKKYDKWQENKYGPGYIRYFEEYEFSSNKEIEDITLNDIMVSANYKNGYTETRLSIPDDLDKKPEIIVTETIQDRTDSKAGNLGIGLGIGVALIGLITYGAMKGAKDFNYRKSDERDIKTDLKNIVKWKVIKERYAKLGKKEVLLKEEQEKALDLYNISKDFNGEMFDEIKQKALR